MNQSENVQVYEIGYHLVPTIAEEHLASEVAAIKTVLEKAGATFIAEEPAQSRALMYTIEKHIGGIIKKFNSAYFGWMKFNLPADKAVEVKKALDTNEHVLRHLFIKTVAENTLYADKLVEKDMKVKKEKVKAEKTTASVEDIDKSIDALVDAEAKA